jgi:hypothetical protein
VDVFLHIPKASGTTIRTIVSREYGVEATLYYEPENENFEHRAAPVTYLRDRLVKANVRLITGHLRYGIHELLCQPCRYFSMVRDPIERALSDYFYAFTYFQHRHRDQIVSGNVSFQDFLAADVVSPATATCYFLGGLFEGLHDAVEAALFQVRHGIVTVGTSERFDESILLIARDLGWRPPLYLRRNVTHLRDGMQDFRLRTREEAQKSLREHFASDYKVYNVVDELMSQRVFYLGSGFRKALDNYRELQAALGQYESAVMFREYMFEKDDALPPPAAALLDSAPYRELAEYLRKDPAVPEDRRSYVGYHDVRLQNGMAGWAMDMSRTTPITVTLRRHDQVVATTLCAIPRPHVAAAGFPDVPCGFRFNLDPPVKNPEEFTVCFENTPIRLRG